VDDYKANCAGESQSPWEQSQTPLSLYIPRSLHHLILFNSLCAVRTSVRVIKTSSLNRKTKQGLAAALQIPSDYLDAVCRGMLVSPNQGIRFCPQCWQPGTSPDSIWLHSRAQYCYVCGTQLRERCVSCDEQIASLKHRFCPYCGTAYRALKSLHAEKES